MEEITKKEEEEKIFRFLL